MDASFGKCERLKNCLLWYHQYITRIFDDITQKDTLSRSHLSNNESTSLINELNAAKHLRQDVEIAELLGRMCKYKPIGEKYMEISEMCSLHDAN